jgi:hypothetical protein
MALIEGRYHLLQSPLSGEWVDKLLGRVVFNMETPTAATAPDRDGPRGTIGDEKTAWIPQKLVPGLEGEPMRYTSLHYLLAKVKDAEMKAQLTDFFEAHATLKTKQKVDILGIEVERYDISNIPTALDDLLQHNCYNDSVKKLLRGKNGISETLGMVTGIFVAKSLTIRQEASKEAGAGASAKVPLSEAIGDPTGTLDIGGGADFSRTNDKEEEMKIDLKCIFAVAYTPVMLSPVPAADLPVDKKKSRWPLSKKSRKIIPDQEYKVEIDMNPGANFYLDGGSSSSSSRQSGVGETLTAQNADGISTTTTQLEDETTLRIFTFTTPDSV